MCGSINIKSAYLRRVFDDEGYVYFENRGKRAVRTCRSSIYKQNSLITGELFLLLSLGINSKIYNEREYASKTGVRTFKKRIQIARQGELLKFNEYIGFSLMQKATKLKAALGSYKQKV